MNAKKRKKTRTTKRRRPKKNREVAVRLFPGERVDLTGDDDSLPTTDEELNSRYARGDVRIVTESARYNLASIRSMLEDKRDGKQRYTLDPEYQRRHRWSIARKSRLIESFLMNVPVPPIFLYERDYAEYEVMDGRQRLTALGDFYGNKFALTALEYWPQLDGRRYSELPKNIRDGIDRRYISAIILLQETAKSPAKAQSLKKMVFERLNTGGVKLSGQETRNAIYDGPLNQLCLKLSRNDKYKEMWGIPDSPPDDLDDPDKAKSPGATMYSKMEDVELVLRFFAYRQLPSFTSGLNRVSHFLDQFLIAGNSFPDALLKRYETKFVETIDFLHSALGLEAFTAIDVRRARGPSKVIYDGIMYVASRLSRPQIKIILRKAPLLREELRKLYNEEKDLFAGRSTNTSQALNREVKIDKVFSTIINDEG